MLPPPILESEASREPSTWLAVASETNCEVLSQLGYPYFALSGNGIHLAARIMKGDHCALYRARRNRGFVGIFEVTGAAERAPTRIGVRLFPIRVPWKIVALSEANALSLAPLVPRLTFIGNKTRPGTYLQSSFRAIPKEDFETIRQAFVGLNATK